MGSGVAPKLGRRTYVLDRGFQLKYTLALVVVGAFISALFGTMMYLVHLDAQHTVDAALELKGPAREAVAQSETTLIYLLAGTTVLMAAALGLFGILITHRVAGPVYVMSHYISVLARGRYPLMRPLRKRDELKQFFERFQGAVEALRLREVDEADHLRDALSQLGPLALTPESKQVLSALKVIHDRKRDATDRVDTGRGTPKA